MNISLLPVVALSDEFMRLDIVPSLGAEHLLILANAAHVHRNVHLMNGGKRILMVLVEADKNKQASRGSQYPL